MNSVVGVELILDKSSEKLIKNLPDKILYEIARRTLDLSHNYIPKSNIVGHAGTLRRSTFSNGVKGSHGDYYISSESAITPYASRVWSLNDATTHWTTKGTHSEWFIYTIKTHQNVVVNQAIDKVRKDNNI